jgi:hypothetical protein
MMVREKDNHYAAHICTILARVFEVSLSTMKGYRLAEDLIRRNCVNAWGQYYWIAERLD